MKIPTFANNPEIEAKNRENDLALSIGQLVHRMTQLEERVWILEHSKNT